MHIASNLSLILQTAGLDVHILKGDAQVQHNGVLSSIKTRERGKGLSCNKIRNSEYKNSMDVRRCGLLVEYFSVSRDSD